MKAHPPIEYAHSIAAEALGWLWKGEGEKAHRLAEWASHVAADCGDAKTAEAYLAFAGKMR